MKSAPLILITASTQRQGVEFRDASLSLSHRYAYAIQAAGGLPWALPASLPGRSIAACVARCDGVLLTGGDDVHPGLYQAKLSPQLKRTVSEVDPQRDLVELQLIEAVFHQRKPLLAICRGQQILNVALGGSLVVDIGSQVPQALDHSRTDRKDEVVHPVALAPDSILAQLAGQTQLGVNSSHHQAVARVARPFRTTALSPDGVIEGLELKPEEGKVLPYLLAVQFHPERLFERHPVFLDLFRGFIVACVAAGQNRC